MCPLVLPSHVAIDQARERASGDRKIGTTGRGIGPGLRGQGRAPRGARRRPADPAQFESRLRELLDYHNFLLEQRFSASRRSISSAMLDDCLAQAERVDAAGRRRQRSSCKRIQQCAAAASCSRARRARCSTSTTAPIPSSLRRTRWPATRAVGIGLGPRDIDDVLGIVKAYTTRVGAGPFPTELFDETGRHLSRVGQEFGAVTGRRAAHAAGSTPSRSRRSILNNGITGLCVTKLDVLDGLEEVKLCTGYDDGRPRYEAMPGWKQRTAGLRTLEELPASARAYLARLESVCAVPVTMISTGAERDDMILSRHPFG